MKKLLLSSLFLIIGCFIYSGLCITIGVKVNIELYLLIVIALDVKQSYFKD